MAYRVKECVVFLIFTASWRHNHPINSCEASSWSTALLIRSSCVNKVIPEGHLSALLTTEKAEHCAAVKFVVKKGLMPKESGFLKVYEITKSVLFQMKEYSHSY